MRNKKDMSERIAKLKLFLLSDPNGMPISDIIAHMGLDRSAVYRYLEDIEATSNNDGLWKYKPNESEIEFAEAIIKAANKKAQSKKAPQRNKADVVQTSNQVAPYRAIIAIEDTE